MTTARLSIIPARAATDRGLKPRDLQVLCVLGRHTDDLGWCRRSQVKMAAEMGCSRSTVYDAIKRLVSRGYLEQHIVESDSGRDSAHLYRVILDPVHADLDSVQPEETMPDPEPGTPCRYIGTPAGISAPPAGPGPAPPAGPGPAPMLTTPLNDPCLTEREGVRAEEDPPDGIKPKKSAREIDKLFRTLVDGWPNFRGMSLRAADREFRKLTGEEMEIAVAKRDLWLALLKSQSKAHPPSPQTYCRDRLWAAVPDDFRGSAEPERRKTAAPFGKMWGAVRMADLCRAPYGPPPKLNKLTEDLIAAGKANRQQEILLRLAKEGWPRVNLMHDRAVSKRSGVPEDPALTGIADPFVQVAKGSALWLAWKDLHAENGWPWLGEDRDCPDWVWMPASPAADYPNDLERVRAAVARFREELEAINERQAAE